MNSQRYWIGIDIGGTLADFVIYDAAEQLLLAYKSARDPPADERLPIFVTNRRFVRGDVISIRTAGGGGYGHVKERPQELIDDDLRSGYISAAAAKTFTESDFFCRDDMTTPSFWRTPESILILPPMNADERR